MRDGTILETRIYYQPEQLLKKNPVMLERTPYGTDSIPNGKKGLKELLSEGFVVIVQDIRGMLQSEGKFSFFRFSGVDNIDTMNWIKEQRWSNGEIGTIGFSAPGITQYMSVKGTPFEAVKNPLFQCIAAASPLAHEHIAYQGGAMRHSLIDHWMEMIKQSWYYDVIKQHEAFTNEFWGPITIEDIGKIHWPAVHIGGWYDIFSSGTLAGWRLYKKNPLGYPQYLIMLSGGHCMKSNIIFPNGEDVISLANEYCPSIYYKKKMKLKLKNLVSLYVINLAMNGTSSEYGNFWISIQDFPKSNDTKFYLKSDHSLTKKDHHYLSSSYETNNITYLFNPNNPTPTKGGNNLMIPCGPRDQSEIEKRNDNIYFTTKPFDQYLSFCGNIRVNLIVSTNASDTDFICRLSDVKPNGESFLLNDGIIRMKWMTNKSEPILLEPFKKYNIVVDLWDMCAIISPAHSLRVTCTSSNYPRFTINGNSGKLLKDETKKDFVVAQNSIHISDDSYLTLPIVNLKFLQENRVDSILEKS